jgi:hypothetical protein
MFLLGSVKKGLTDITIDHQFSALDDLAQLILPVAMQVYLGAIQTGTGIVADIAVEINPKVGRVRPEAAGRKSPAPPVKGNQVLPSEIVCQVHPSCRTILSFRLEQESVQHQDGFTCGRRTQAMAGVPIQTPNRLQGTPFFMGYEGTPRSSRLL